MREFRKPPLRAIVAIISLIVVVTIIVGSDFLINGPKAKQIRNELENELSLIQPMPEATFQGHRSSSKPRQALVGNRYFTRLGYSEIRSYYDRELSRLGWTFKEERPLKTLDGDFGGKIVGYCKGEHTASLQYAGEQADYGWTYGLDLSWGLHKCE